MNRRTKLSKAERTKRSAKRARRRPMSQMKRRLQGATRILIDAYTFPIRSEIVCDRCGFVQPHVEDEDGYPLDEDGLVLCLRGEILGIPCSGVWARTIEYHGYVGYPEAEEI